MDKEITCADGGIKKRRSCWVIEEETAKDISKLLDINNYERRDYNELYSSRNKAQEELKIRSQQAEIARKAAAAAEKQRIEDEKNFVINNRKKINEIKSTISYLMKSVMNVDRIYRRDMAKVINGNTGIGCGMECLESRYGYRIFNIALEESGHKSDWNFYKP